MSKALAGTSLLMVDDDPDGLALPEFVVELAGAAVRSATNARDALAALATFKPDVMLHAAPLLSAAIADPDATQES